MGSGRRGIKKTLSVWILTKSNVTVSDFISPVLYNS